MTYEEHAAKIVAEADLFVASDFRGRATYARAEATTLAGARREAIALMGTRDRAADPSWRSRPVGIYAVKGTHQVHVENISPGGTSRTPDQGRARARR